MLFCKGHVGHGAVLAMSSLVMVLFGQESCRCCFAEWWQSNVVCRKGLVKQCEGIN